jgi:actin related protein 2/3 complex subunit 2
LISKFAHLKSIAMSSPFLAAFEEQKTLQANYKEPAGAQQMDLAPSEQKGELKIVKYREEEAIFIQASHDRVTIIFSTVFKEETDRVYGRVFLQVSWLALSGL